MLHVRRLLNSAAKHRYDVIVVGGGHAGCEAASAAARMGASTALITHRFDTIGEMSCNPSFGGIGKGHLMREIDALGGLSPGLCDLSGTSYKVLNRSKGPAVWGIRAQIDRAIYKAQVQQAIQAQQNLKVLEASVENLCLEEGTCTGVSLESGEVIEAQAVILTTGTFLKGMINIGLETWPAGRIGDKPAIGLANTLNRLGFRLGRLKTGTPPRLVKSSIDFNQLPRLPSDNPPVPFSFLNDRVWLEPDQQLDSRWTHTELVVEDIVKENMHQNIHVTEEVTGPRYCPSIEAKVLRFPGRRHQVFLEPEGFTSDLIYPNGISCTMPEGEQLRMVRTMQGCERAELARPGYGVAYDFIDPRELFPSLQTKKVPGLFFAGQINGTTGYEEAAAQGIVAGINAVRAIQGEKYVMFNRLESYIGVLIDDLTTHGTIEPYRMFTARSEFRLYLRPDNADLRLTEKGYEAGCVPESRYKKFLETKTSLEKAKFVLQSKTQSASMWAKMVPSISRGRNPQHKSGFQMLAHEDLVLDELLDACDHHPDLMTVARNRHLLERLKIEALYSPIIEIQMRHIKELSRNEETPLPVDLDFESRELNLSLELKTKLELARPATIGAASRIQGMTPDALLRLLGAARRSRRALDG